MAGKTVKKLNNSPRIRNKKARFQYSLLERFEAGIELQGSEVKSLRQGQASLAEAYASIHDGEMYLNGANIPVYECSGILNHEPTRPRKLLMHRREITKLGSRIEQKGCTIVPLDIYFKRGWAKVELALATGKREFDKRDTIRKRESQREIDRAMSSRR